MTSKSPRSSDGTRFDQSYCTIRARTPSRRASASMMSTSKPMRCARVGGILVDVGLAACEVGAVVEDAALAYRGERAAAVAARARDDAAQHRERPPPHVPAAIAASVSPLMSSSERPAVSGTAMNVTAAPTSATPASTNKSPFVPITPSSSGTRTPKRGAEPPADDGQRLRDAADPRRRELHAEQAGAGDRARATASVTL